MRLRFLSILAAILALAWCGPFAQAGAIRYAGEKLHDGSIAVAQKTAEATGTAAGGVGDAGKEAGSAIKDGASTVGRGAASAPGWAVHGTKAAASKVWMAVW